MRRNGVIAIAAILLCLCSFSAPCAGNLVRATVIVCPQEASPLTAFAAREVRRYVYLRTGDLLPIVESAKDAHAIVVTRKDSPAAEAFAAEASAKTLLDGLGSDDYVLRTVDQGDRREVYLIGGSDTATLYAAYRFAEHLGVRFYLHGDVVPDMRIPLELPELDEHRSPLFELRGIQPFHDFPEGPDWWNPDDYKAIIAQLPKLGMNFFGLHTYPENRPNAEPTVWIGLPEDVGPEGKVAFGYPAIYYNTALPVGWGFQATKTSDYACGAAALFDRDDFGSDIMRGVTPRPDTPEEHNEVFNRTSAMFKEAFGLAHLLGVKTCIGTETPLVVPELVKKRLEDPGKTVQDLYEGIFTRIMRSHHLDYYWFWTPEGWTWQGVKEEQVKQTIDDILAAHAAARNVGAPFQLATCGWVLGPQHDRALLGKALPHDIAVSCINRQVGHDPVEPAFADVEGRGKWAIPWLEDDPAMTSVQLWAGRMRRDARDALEYGCTGLMGIHWRTRILAPNVAALAQAAWDQSGWPDAGEKTSGPVGGSVASFENTDFADTDDDPLYRTVRYNMSAYRLVVPDGEYTVTLRLCEPHFKEKGERVFGVKLEGKTVIEKLDVLAQVGPDHALDYTFKNVEVRDGQLDIDFVKGVEFPCIAAIAVEGNRLVQKINCGGPVYKDYSADLTPLPEHVPAQDFYADWALHEFGPEVAADATDILSAVDGKLPRPSDWINGPGGYRLDRRLWERVKSEYDFVDKFAELRPRVKGSGNLERFDYWLNNFQFLRATARMSCAWGAYDKAVRQTQKETSPAARTRLARNKALPMRVELIAAVEEAYRHLLATVTTTGAMGTVCNLEQHTFPTMLDEPGEKLAEILGEPLPAEAQLSKTYKGPARLIVPTKRTCLSPGEPLTVKAIVLGADAPRLCWGSLGTRSFDGEPLRHVGRNTYEAQLPADRIGGSDIEYYVEAVAADNKVIRWPASAPFINQTVVIGPQ